MMRLRDTWQAFPLFDSLADQNVRLDYVLDEFHPCTVGLNYLPSFQWVVAGSLFPTKIEVVNANTDAVVRDVYNEAILTGLKNQFVPGESYKLIEYPGNSRLGTNLFEEGLYYLKVYDQTEDPTRVWYTDVFRMVADEDQLILLEFSHNEPLHYPGGAFVYKNGFQNRIWLCADLPFPAFENDLDVAEVEGRDLPLRHVMKKIYKLKAVLPEGLINALSLVQLHDSVKMTVGSQEWDLDQFLITNVSPTASQDLAEVDIDIVSDTIAVVYGRGVIGDNSETPAGSCLFTNYNVVAVLEESGAEYQGAYYVDDGSQFSIESGDRILAIDSSGNTYLKQYNGTSFSLVGGVMFNQVAYDARDGFYWRAIGNGFEKNRITQLNGPFLQGAVIPNSSITVEIWGRNAGGDYLSGTATLIEFTSSPGADFVWRNGTYEVYIKISNPLCGVFETHEPFSLPFPCFIRFIASKYKQDGEATLSGVQDGQYYVLDVDNIYAWREGLLKQLGSSQSNNLFSTKAAALSTLGPGACYLTAASNVWGAPQGLLRVTAGGPWNRYPSRSAAAAAGVSNYFILSSGNTYNIDEGFVMSIS